MKFDELKEIRAQKIELKESLSQFEQIDESQESLQFCSELEDSNQHLSKPAHSFYSPKSEFEASLREKEEIQGLNLKIAVISSKEKRILNDIINLKREIIDFKRKLSRFELEATCLFGRKEECQDFYIMNEEHMILNVIDWIGNSEIYKVISKKTGEQAILRVYNEADLIASPTELIDIVKKQNEQLSDIDPNSFIEVLDVFTLDHQVPDEEPIEYLWVLEELCTGPDLGFYLTKNNKMQRDEAESWVKHINKICSSWDTQAISKVKNVRTDILNHISMRDIILDQNKIKFSFVSWLVLNKKAIKKPWGISNILNRIQKTQYQSC